MLPLEEQREERDPRRIDEEHDEDVERSWFARAHFPHLSPSVAPRESDETPTFWEDA